MISKYRNRAVGLIFLAVILTVLTFIVWEKSFHGPRNNNWEIAGILLYFVSWVLWISGSLDLAKGKGYNRDIAGTMFLVFLILGCCFPIAPLLFPFVIIFGLEDKTKSRRRRR